MARDTLQVCSRYQPHSNNPAIERLGLPGPSSPDPGTIREDNGINSLDRCLVSLKATNISLQGVLSVHGRPTTILGSDVLRKALG